MKQPVPPAQQRLDVSNRAGAADTAYEKPQHYTIFFLIPYTIFLYILPYTILHYTIFLFGTIFLYCDIISLSLSLVHSEPIPFLSYNSILHSRNNMTLTFYC